MKTEGMIVGLTGPSGVGKGYLKDHLRGVFPNIAELTVATTRMRRMSDGEDRDTDIPVGIFLERAHAGEVIFAHQPFGPEGDWYGFYHRQIEQLLQQGRLILTEIHVDNVRPFKEKYGHRIVVLGLVAAHEYLEGNLLSRGTESFQEQQRRLEAARVEATNMQNLHREGLVDLLFEVNYEMRGEIAGIAQRHLESVVSSFGKEKYE